MKPNILIITIDSLRADKCFGDNSLYLPNFSRLIKKGIYFRNTFTSVPATVGSLGCMFTGEYPFKTGISIFHEKSENESFFEIFKNSSYHRFATVPDVIFFNKWMNDFDGLDKTEMFGSLDNEIGAKILERLESNKMIEPWIYYIHLMDLHPNANEQFRIPDEFNKKKYGDTEYDRAVFFVDYWLGKICKKINFENTLVIITSDHGHDGEVHSKNKKLKKIIVSGKILGSRFYGFGKKLYKTVNMISGEHQQFFSLSDKILGIPLIFVGHGIKKHMIINELSRNIDIFPTVSNLINLSKKTNISGRTLLPLFQNKILQELPIYIENKIVDLKMDNSSIGIRSSHYKYYRDRKNVHSKVNLYNLKKDPFEKMNIAEENPDIVLQMENILEDMQNHSPNQNNDTEIDEEGKIREELKKLGYI